MCVLLNTVLKFVSLPESSNHTEFQVSEVVGISIIVNSTQPYN